MVVFQSIARGVVGGHGIRAFTIAEPFRDNGKGETGPRYRRPAQPRVQGRWVDGCVTTGSACRLHLMASSTACSSANCSTCPFPGQLHSRMDACSFTEKHSAGGLTASRTLFNPCFQPPVSSERFCSSAVIAGCTTLTYQRTTVGGTT